MMLSRLDCRGGLYVRYNDADCKDCVDDTIAKNQAQSTSPQRSIYYSQICLHPALSQTSSYNFIV